MWYTSNICPLEPIFSILNSPHPCWSLFSYLTSTILCTCERKYSSLVFLRLFNSLSCVHFPVHDITPVFFIVWKSFHCDIYHHPFMHSYADRELGCFPNSLTVDSAVIASQCKHLCDVHLESSGRYIGVGGLDHSQFVRSLHTDFQWLD